MSKTFCKCGCVIEYVYEKPETCPKCKANLRTVISSIPSSTLTTVIEPAKPVVSPAAKKFSNIQVSLDGGKSTAVNKQIPEEDEEEKTSFTSDIRIQNLGIERNSITLGEAAVGDKSNLARSIRRRSKNHESFKNDLFSGKPIEL